jgi:hypothetical protein
MRPSSNPKQQKKKKKKGKKSAPKKINCIKERRRDCYQFRETSEASNQRQCVDVFWIHIRTK